MYVSLFCCKILHISFAFEKSLPLFIDGLLFIELLLLDSTDKVSNCFWRFLATHLQLSKYGHENEMYNVGVEVKERECL